LASIEREYAWIQDFDVLVWSYQLRIAKPDPAIYNFVLKSSALFRGRLSSRRQAVNVDAARHWESRRSSSPPSTAPRRFDPLSLDSNSRFPDAIPGQTCVCRNPLHRLRKNSFGR